MDPDAMYEEVDINQESDAKDQNTDSESEMQEVIVGEEEVIEQHLDEVVLYDNAFEGRAVRRRPEIVVKKESSLKQMTLPSPSHHQTRVQRPGQLARQAVRVSPATKVVPVNRPKVGQVAQLAQSGISMKRRMDGHSPLIVKLEGIKRTKTLEGTSARPVAATPPKPPMRVVRHSQVQTEITSDLMDQYQQIIEEDQQKIAVLEQQVAKLKYTPEMFENDDKRTQYFTGLETFVNMVTLFNSCEPELPASPTLTKFEIFILTLLKLRLKLPLPFLGYTFGVSAKTANYFYNECVTVLHTVMRDIFADSLETVEAK